MKAAFYEGEHKIRLGDCQPVPPKADEVQIRVSHCGICGTDLHIYHGHMDQRVTMPQIMGHEVSGVVSAIGEQVDGFSIGDPVAIRPLDTRQCKARDAEYAHICEDLKFLGIDTAGAFQSYWTIPANTLHRLPDSLSLKYGAMMEPLAVACHDVRLGGVNQGDDVVVIGAGPIGTLVALVARQRGANVIISEISPFRVDFARELGFQVVNPQTQDLKQVVMELSNGRGADVVFEVTGSASGAAIMTELPRIRGTIVVVGIFSHSPPVDLFKFFWRELKLIGARVYEPEDFDRAIELADSGELPLEQLITTVLPLDDLKAGLDLMDSGEAMKILIEVEAE